MVKKGCSETGAVSCGRRWDYSNAEAIPVFSGWKPGKAPASAYQEYSNLHVVSLRRPSQQRVNLPLQPCPNVLGISVILLWRDSLLKVWK